MVLNIPGPPPSTIVLHVPLVHSWSTLILLGQLLCNNTLEIADQGVSRWTRRTRETLELGVGPGVLWSFFYILLMNDKILFSFPPCFSHSTAQNIVSSQDNSSLQSTIVNFYHELQIFKKKKLFQVRIYYFRKTELCAII